MSILSIYVYEYVKNVHTNEYKNEYEKNAHTSLRV